MAVVFTKSSSFNVIFKEKREIQREKFNSRLTGKLTLWGEKIPSKHKNDSVRRSPERSRGKRRRLWYQKCITYAFPFAFIAELKRLNFKSKIVSVRQDIFGL